MELARVLVCLCVCVVAGVVHGQVASICRPNERLLMCGGCQKTCLDPVPDCKGVCRPGCYCATDEVRNATGHCVALSECPKLPASYKLETTEPRPADAKCPDNEEYRFCEACNKTCDNPSPICPAQCSRGCFCKADLVRDRDGRCVELEKCSNKSSNEIPHSSLTEKPIDEQKCGFNQVFKPCSNCEKTCSNPNPQCPAQCSRGCFCKDGLYRAPNGDCVSFDKCPIAHSSLTEKPIDEQTCGVNQVFKPCSNCEKTCSNPNPQCPAQCSRGCFCKDGLYKAPNGDCVSFEKCPIAIPVTTNTPAIVYEMTCGPNQVFKQCESCEKTCSSPNSDCPAQCSRGCFCKDGLYKAPNGECVKLENCPKAEISMGLVSGPSIEDCDADEEFFSCGWCEPSCSDPDPDCPLKVCTRGCLCRPPLLRHRSGHCVERKDCLGQKCPPNEEYVCRYGCEASCSRRACVLRPRRCRLACHCRRGLLRDSIGQCVLPDQCY